MTEKKKKMPLLLLSISAKASGLKTKLSLGVCNRLCYELMAELTENMTGKARSVHFLLLSITLIASGLKTRLSLGDM